jgi:PAS domain S-box-containing protein
MSFDRWGGPADRFRGQDGEIKEFILSKDWSKTPLGALKDWPESLTFAVNLCLNSKFPIAIWWSKYLVSIYNESFRDLFHLKHAESLGTTGVDLWPGFFQDMGSSLHHVLEEGMPTIVDKNFTFTEGNDFEERSLSFYVSPIYDEPGKVGGVLTTVTQTRLPVSTGTGVKVHGHTLLTASRILADELEEKVKQRTALLERRNEELKRTEERYTKMTEEVEDYAIILLDKDGTILNWNKGAQKIKGYTEAEIIGSNFSIFYLEEDLKRNLPGKLIQTAIEEGRAMHEGFRKRKDGTNFWGSIVITALHGDANNVIGFTKVTRDLTERKAAEDRIRQHASELEVKNNQLEQFAYIASHDLQEPLRKIQTFVQILEKNVGNQEIRQKYFAKIEASAKRMSDLIQSVLHYSRLAQPNELWAPVDLNEVVQSVLGDYELLISEKNAVVKYDTLPVISGIRSQLGQLFSNLLGNSLKFSREKPEVRICWKILAGEDLQIRFSTADISKQYIELQFSDNGIGFEQQYSEKIFAIFQRLNAREEFAGTGIGLALSMKIVENHNGYISAKSALGKGATFFIHLPYK